MVKQQLKNCWSVFDHFESLALRANINLTEERVQVLLSEKEFIEPPEFSSNTFKKRNIDRYTQGPNISLCNGNKVFYTIFVMQNFKHITHLVINQIRPAISAI